MIGWTGSLIAAGLTVAPASAAGRLVGVANRVADGDTLWVRPASGGVPRKLRVHGIDAPEICQAGGAAARAALERLVIGKSVDAQLLRKDDFGRWVARIHVAGTDVGEEMVRQGQAWSYRYRNRPGPYATQESQARAARIGLFRHPAERPYAFRRRNGPCPPAD